MTDLSRSYIESLSAHGLRLHEDRMEWVLAHATEMTEGAIRHALHELSLVRDRLRQLA